MIILYKSYPAVRPGGPEKRLYNRPSPRRIEEFEDILAI